MLLYGAMDQLLALVVRYSSNMYVANKLKLVPST
jgi:hypothetical protein